MTNGPTENIILDGALIGKLRVGIEDVFTITSIETPRQAEQGTIIFLGHLTIPDSEAAYDLIAGRWQPHSYTPILRQQQDQVALVAQPGVITPKPSNLWINLILAAATLASVLFTGAAYECQCVPVTPAQWLTGLPMMLTMMAILLAHEFGHYFAARYHQVAVTLPYFIPLPIISPVGTLGAFIQLRSPFKTKKQLFDIGVAGPLAGFIVAVPLLFWGIAHSTVREIDRVGGSVLEGNSIFYLGVKYLLHGQLLPSFDRYSDVPFWQEFLMLLAGMIPPGGGRDVFIDSLTFAAWFGLLVTAMNLLPVGQLDGGHVAYCLYGQSARLLGIVLVGLMLVAGLFWWSGWLFWAFLVFLVIGVGHPPPLNDLPSLGWPRQLLAYLMFLIFILLFMPNPLQPL
jgi:membrane-associated protease RseP (regulator of RpoE activity)